MIRVNQTILLLLCLTAWLVSAAPIPADPPELPGPPGGYTLAVSDSVTPMERQAGVLLREGLGIGEADPRKAAAQPSRGFGGIGGSEGRRMIYVGVSLASMTLGRARATPVDWASLGGDGVVIFKADNGDMVIAGGRAPGGGGRGTVHAAVRFLEDQRGCRWWPDGTRYVPNEANPRQSRGLWGEGDEPYELIGGGAQALPGRAW